MIRLGRLKMRLMLASVLALAPACGGEVTDAAGSTTVSGGGGGAAGSTTVRGEGGGAAGSTIVRGGDGGRSGAGGVEQTDAGPSALGIPCLQGPGDKICLRNPAGCGPDIASYAASLPRCNAGGWGRYVAQCGDYEAIIEWGVDTTDLWYFDPRDGRVVAHVATGMQQPECSTADPGFSPPPCEVRWCANDAGL